eukprot:TRINITY_DN8918_c0_g1_i1.p1 TRINITY_DN8918_c0_g1~~TRINITY_DN8918_c0_g1_i1.p1  ORF type:complete len:112 (+),score=12.10 TRINITY_DN8918_c0_g1_i1:137-472(+)
MRSHSGTLWSRRWPWPGSWCCWSLCWSPGSPSLQPRCSAGSRCPSPPLRALAPEPVRPPFVAGWSPPPWPCLLYTSDAADEEDSVDLGGRRIIKKKKKVVEEGADVDQMCV